MQVRNFSEKGKKVFFVEKAMEKLAFLKIEKKTEKFAVQGVLNSKI